jgi:hypothetical protein
MHFHGKGKSEYYVYNLHVLGGELVPIKELSAFKQRGLLEFPTEIGQQNLQKNVKTRVSTIFALQ